MPQSKFSPAKQVVKMRKLSVEFSTYNYSRITRVAKARRLSVREFIRQAVTYALDNLEKEDG